MGIINNLTPSLNISSIKDDILKQNFQSLQNYFQVNNQLVGFNFFEVNLSKASTKYAVAHGLSYVPSDIVVTQCTGLGQVTFLYGQFDSTNVYLTTTGSCRVRFFVGTFWNQQSKVAPKQTDALLVNPSGIITSNYISSGQATINQILTADGKGGSAWQSPTSSNFGSGDATVGQLLTANGFGGTTWGNPAYVKLVFNGDPTTLPSGSISNGTVYTLLFPVSYNTNSTSYNSSSGVWTCPVTGVYNFQCTLYFTGTFASNGEIYAQLRDSAGALLETLTSTSVVGALSVSLSSTQYITRNTQLWFAFETANWSTVSLLANSNYLYWASICQMP